MKYPIFLQHGYSLIKILDKSTYIDVCDDSYDTGVMIKKLAPNVVKMMLRDGKPIREETFNAALLMASNCLSRLTFMCVTTPATDQERFDEEIHINDLENVMR